MAHQDGSMHTAELAVGFSADVNMGALEDGTGEPAPGGLYDPDGDGIPSLVELRLGLRPTQVDTMDPPASLVRLPAVDFAFGSNDAEALPSEKPEVMQHVGALEVDAVEVTNRQYRVCMGKVNDGMPGCTEPVVTVMNRDYQLALMVPDSELDPVVGLAPEQAEHLCKKRGMRLPTEVEWERMARISGDNVQERLDYPWPTSLGKPTLVEGRNPCTLGRFMLYSSSFIPMFCTGDEAHPGVGRVLDDQFNVARAFINGLGDLAGNAAEWTSSAYQSDLHELLSADAGIPEESTYVYTTRGGSYLSGPRFVRTYARAPVDASVHRPEVLGCVGVRCVRDWDGTSH